LAAWIATVASDELPVPPRRSQMPPRQKKQPSFSNGDSGSWMPSNNDDSWQKMSTKKKSSFRNSHYMTLKNLTIFEDSHFEVYEEDHHSKIDQGVRCCYQLRFVLKDKHHSGKERCFGRAVQ
jgi:hypothetical protein